MLQPSPAPAVASPTPATDAALRPDAVIAPGAPANDNDELIKVRRVHQVVGKSAANLVEGLLKRSVKWAGREPEDMDDDERALIAEGCSELAAEYLGKTKLTPGGKVMAGAICAGVGMYMGGKPIPKPAKPPLKLVPGHAPPVNDNGALEDPSNDNGGPSE